VRLDARRFSIPDRSDHLLVRALSYDSMIDSALRIGPSAVISSLTGCVDPLAVAAAGQHVGAGYLDGQSR
jgi:hypothetical protein